jgi:adenosyl cobinamide kinase/adenosyl cobinamide phosphate guanylyltransferase
MLIGISGKARSGKDTFAEMLSRELQEQTGQAYVLMAYAHELKLKVQKDFDLSYEQLWGEEKEIEDKRYRKHTDKDEMVYWTAREIMQNYGQFFRTINYDFWVDHLFSVIEEKEYKTVIITDLRHTNEVNAVVDGGGFHVRVEREEDEATHNKQHISETALDERHRIDFTVNNYWTLKELKSAAKDVARFLVDSNLESFSKS